MKKISALAVTVALIFSAFSIIPANAQEGGFNSNMEGWNAGRYSSTWDFNTGVVTTAGNTEASSTTSVLSGDNWCWNADVTPTYNANEPVYWFRFGYSGGENTHYYLQINPNNRDVRVRYWNGTSNLNYKVDSTGFPATSDKNNFNVKISYTNGICYWFIDDVLINSGDLSTDTLTYNGSEKFLLSIGNNVQTVYSNVNLYKNNNYLVNVNNAFVNSNNGFRSLTDDVVCKANISGNNTSEYLTFEFDYRYISGNSSRYTVFFGDGVYTLRCQQNTTTLRPQFAIYSSSKIVGWTDAPAGVDINNNKIKLVITPTKVQTYIDNNLILTGNIEYSGGEVMLETYKSVGEFTNMKMDYSKYVTTTDGGWDRVNLTVDSQANIDAKFQVNPISTTDFEMYNLHFGISKSAAPLDDGYSLRIQKNTSTDTEILARGSMMAAIYHNSDNKKCAGWSYFTPSSENGTFTVNLRKTGDFVRAEIDNTVVLCAMDTVMDGAFTFIETRKTAVRLNILSVTAPTLVIGDVNGDGTVSADDLIFAKKYMLDYNPVMYKDAFDCNNDNQKDIKDLIRIKKILSSIVV